MNKNKSNYLFLALWLSFACLPFHAMQAQQVLETDLITNESCFFSTTYVNYGALYKDRIELLELAAGESGHVEFSFDHFDNVDLFIGLQNVSNATEEWLLQFQNGEVFIDGTSYGNYTSGDVFQVARCESSIQYKKNDNTLLETALSNNSFDIQAIVEVETLALNSGNKPHLSLQFPFVTTCESTPSVTSTTYYSDLKKQLDGGYVRLTSPFLRFKYIEEYAVLASENNALPYKIYDWDRGAPVQEGQLTKTFGTNLLSLPLYGIVTNQYYTMEVEDAKGVKSYLRFYYYCPPGMDCFIVAPPPPSGLNGDSNNQLSEE